MTVRSTDKTWVSLNVSLCVATGVFLMSILNSKGPLTLNTTAHTEVSFKNLKVVLIIFASFFLCLQLCSRRSDVTVSLGCYNGFLISAPISRFLSAFL